MKAVTKLSVLDDMEISINLVMTVREVKRLREELKGVHNWPVEDLKRVLMSSIGAAFDEYESEKQIG